MLGVRSLAMDNQPSYYNVVTFHLAYTVVSIKFQ